MKQVQVGLFKLPGLSFEEGQITEDLQNEMIAWTKENHCGTSMTETLWSFKNEAHREWFILRWNDSIPKVESDK